MKIDPSRSFEHPASNIEPPLVKPLHELAEIAALLAGAGGHAVRLHHAVGGQPLSAARGRIPSLDAAAATQQALAEPLEYPPLAAGIVPGDRVAIAVADSVPSLTEVIRGVVLALTHAGVEPQNISVVTTSDQATARCQLDLAESDPELRLVTHQPADENNLCLVGTTKRGEPLLINRTIFEADLILPIGCARIGLDHPYHSLYPSFSNAETIARYRTPAEHDALALRSGKRSPGEEAGWMIGVPMTIQVVPGPADSVAHVVAGEPHTVARRANELCQQQWSYQSPQKVSLMVATITGNRASQTWSNVARALETAEHVLEEGGALALCTNLEDLPGRSLSRLVGDQDLDIAARKISRDDSPDSWAAWLLTRALQRGPVYLLSRLSSEIPEEMGLAPVEDVEDLVRLAGRHDSFLVVEDAQHAVVVVGDGNDDY